MKIKQQIFAVFLTSLVIVLWRANQIVGNIDLGEVLWVVLGLSLLGISLFFALYLKARQQLFAFILTAFILLYAFTASFPVEWAFVRLRWKVEIAPFYVYLGIYLLALLSFILVLFLLIRNRNKIENHTNAAHFLGLYILIFALEGLYLGVNLGQSYLKVPSFSDKQRAFTQLLPNELPAKFPAADSLPDIYFLLFDECVNPRIIADYGRAEAHTWYPKLQSQGFFTADSTLSNYAYTAKSMPSMLNMHLDLQENTLSEWNVALMEEAKLAEVLKQANYTLHNYSIFPFAHQAKRAEINGYPLLYHSLWDYMRKRSVFCQLPEVKYELLPLDDTPYLLSVLAEKKEHLPAHPQFYYFHFTLPHEPFRYKADGTKWKEGESESLKREDLFAAQSVYSFDVMQQCIALIQEQTKGKAIIIISGDHGIRYDMHHFTKGYLAQKYQPFHAVYFPNKDYTHYPQKHSLVNTFPLVLNQFLKTKFPIVPHVSFDEKGNTIPADSLKF